VQQLDAVENHGIVELKFVECVFGARYHVAAAAERKMIPLLVCLEMPFHTCGVLIFVHVLNLQLARAMDSCTFDFSVSCAVL
jgi:hypothetical protein